MVKGNWHAFNKENTDSALYLICLNPRNLHEAAKIIHRKNPRKVNQEPLIKCRDKYLGYGFDMELYGKSVRDFKIVSRADPFLEYIKEQLKTRGECSKKKDYIKFTDTELDTVKRVFDSKWFRGTFFKDSLLVPDQYGSIYFHMSSDEKTGKIRIHGALRAIASVLEPLATISMVFFGNPRFRGIFPSVSDMGPDESFDNFAERWYGTHYKNENETERIIANTFVLASKSLGNYKVTNKFLGAVLHSKYFMCIPCELLNKLIRIGRIETTISDHFNDALKINEIASK